MTPLSFCPQAVDYGNVAEWIVGIGAILVGITANRIANAIRSTEENRAHREAFTAAAFLSTGIRDLSGALPISARLLRDASTAPWATVGSASGELSRNPLRFFVADQNLQIVNQLPTEVARPMAALASEAISWKVLADMAQAELSKFDSTTPMVMHPQIDLLIDRLACRLEGAVTNAKAAEDALLAFLNRSAVNGRAGIK